MLKLEIWTLVGFLLFMCGVLSVILSMVGLELVFLQWLTDWNAVVSFFVKLMMIFGGVAMMYVFRNKTQ